MEVIKVTHWAREITPGYSHELSLITPGLKQRICPCGDRGSGWCDVVGFEDKEKICESRKMDSPKQLENKGRGVP